MTIERDPELAIQIWLGSEVERLPDQVKHAVLAEIVALPQTARRSAPEPRRVSRRDWLGLAAAMVLVTAAITGAALLRGQGPRVGGTTATPSPSVTPTPAPTVAETPIVPGRVPVEGDPVTVFLPDASEPPPGAGPTAPSTLIGADGPLSPGRYRIPQVAGTTVGYRTLGITVPAGWTLDGRRIVKHAGGGDEVALGWWVVANVYHDPCHWTTSPVSQLDLSGHAHTDKGMTITEPADAGLQGQLGRMSSPLRLIFLGGVLTVRVELEIPSDLAISACDQSRYVRWSDLGSDGAVNDHARPGQVDDVYEVDVDRRPLTIDVSHGPAATPADLSELQAIVDSMVVDR